MRIKRLSAVLIILVLASPIYLFAQSNERIDELLLQEPARYDSTAYLVLAAGGFIAETDTPDAAFLKAKEMGLAGIDLSPDSPVRIDELSFMLMKSLSIKGGVMYGFFPGRRYAYRELAFLKKINESGGPARAVNGEEVIRTLGYASALKGGAK